MVHAVWSAARHFGRPRGAPPSLTGAADGSQGPIASISFSPTRGVLASASWDKTVKVWNVFQDTGANESVRCTAFRCSS